MSFRRKLLQIKANWEIWEKRLSVASAVSLAAAAAANVGLFFSARGTPSLPGTVFSWLYLILWSLAAILLRNRAGWVRAACIVRWAAVASILLGIAASGGDGLFSALCVIPYAVCTSVYGGLSRAAWVAYLLPLAQAVAAALLFRRLRRRKAGQDGR